MTRLGRIGLLSGTACVALLSSGAFAEEFNIPGGDMKAALDAYAKQAGVQLIYSDDAIKDARTKGMKGDLAPDAALTRLLSGSGLSVYRRSQGIVAIVRGPSASNEQSENITPMQLAQAAPARAAVETVTVTSSKLGGADVQSIPIAITALSQEQLTATQTAGGPDLVKQVPNLTFTKTNFTGYSIQIRGIGTQAISVTTDPAVAVALNDIPFIRNHFFEQEFYDVSQVEVLRGPQGTLYGRNATAGVVNMISAKPTDQFEAMASADIGNYQNRRFEGMINLPIVDDRLDLRIAGEWTKRDGYSFNETTDTPIDGRDLWSSRVTLGFKPISNLQTYLVWEHFQEDDDRLRSAKQLCKTDYGPGGTPTNGIVNIGGVIKPVGPGITSGNWGDYFTQGCVAASLYSPESFEAPLGYTLPYVLGAQYGSANPINPYASETQSQDLRVINSGLNPIYRANNDTLEFNADYALTPALTVTSQTGYNRDFLWSTEDYNRFGSVPGFFMVNDTQPPDPSGLSVCTFTTCENGGVVSGQPCVSGLDTGCSAAGIVCDPQLGCSSKLIVEDLAEEHSWQFSQEFRIASNFTGPFNFSAGGNYLHYETAENYYVFSNAFLGISEHLGGLGSYPYGYQFNDPTQKSNTGDALGGYIDPNPLSSLNNNGHNYFLSENPYTLNSYAVFGEANYKISDTLKFTAGLRWTDDRKHFDLVPSWLLIQGWGYPVTGTVDQQWGRITGRSVVNWTPKLTFTDQTLVYGSYSHGYKAGGANPPGALFPSEVTNTTSNGAIVNLTPTHPLTFKPEYIDAYELGTKNTLLDGSLTVNGDVFFYNYTGYQISQIVDRTAINQNFNAKVKGAELETSWEPLPGLKFKFTGGYEHTRIDDGQSAVDLMDRTAGQPGWVVSKPWVEEASNCIFPVDVAKYFLHGGPSSPGPSYCAFAYESGVDPITGLPYTANPTATAFTINGIPAGYPGYDPSTAPNDGTGFSKNLGGNELPNAPHFTTSLSADYTLPVSDDWAATLHSDFYWQSQSWWRVFNDNAYDRLNGYKNVNLALILTGQSGWQVMGYVKNIFNTTAITGAFLNSDDSGLTTNVFLTDPRLYGVRITKNW